MSLRNSELENQFVLLSKCEQDALGKLRHFNVKIILDWFSCKRSIHLSDVYSRCAFKSVPQIEYNSASGFMGNCGSLANPGVTATLAVCYLCQAFGIHSSTLRWSEGADQ